MQAHTTLRSRFCQSTLTYLFLTYLTFSYTLIWTDTYSFLPFSTRDRVSGYL